jgi:hypothetical protein
VHENTKNDRDMRFKTIVITYKQLIYKEYKYISKCSGWLKVFSVKQLTQLNPHIDSNYLATQKTTREKTQQILNKGKLKLCFDE